MTGLYLTPTYEQFADGAKKSTQKKPKVKIPKSKAAKYEYCSKAADEAKPNKAQRACRNEAEESTGAGMVSIYDQLAAKNCVSVVIDGNAPYETNGV